MELILLMVKVASVLGAEVGLGVGGRVGVSNRV